MHDLNIRNFIENLELMTLKTELYKNNALLLKSNKKLDVKKLNAYVENNISITFNLKLMSLYLHNFQLMKENKLKISQDLAASVSEIVKVRLDIRHKWNAYIAKTGNSKAISQELKSIYELPQYIDELNDHVSLAEDYIQSRNLSHPENIDNQDLFKYIDQNHSQLRTHNDDLKVYFKKISYFNDLIAIHDTKISEIVEHFKSSDIIPAYNESEADELEFDEIDANLEKALADLDLDDDDFDYDENEIEDQEMDLSQAATEHVETELPQERATYVEQKADTEDKFSLEPVRKPQSFTVTTNDIRKFEEKDIDV